MLQERPTALMNVLFGARSDISVVKRKRIHLSRPSRESRAKRDRGDPGRRVLALPFHLLCLIEIAGLGVVPGWLLFTMLRRAAPLRRVWNAALATLASVALGAAATQFLCPIDDPAHQLVGHLLPVACLSVWGAIAGRRWLNW
jgi:Negative regulator of sigma F